MDHLWGLGAGDHGRSFAYLVGTAAMLWSLSLAKRSFWLFSLLVLPGTLCHEVCHWMVGGLLNGRPVHFTVFPKRVGRGLVLGSVVFSNLRWYNAFFIGLAPLLLLVAAYGLFLWRLGGHPVFGWKEAGVVFFLANLLFGAVPSWQDLRVAARSPIGWLLLVGALAYGWRRFLSPPPAATRVQPTAFALPIKPGALGLDICSATGSGSVRESAHYLNPQVGSS